MRRANLSFSAFILSKAPFSISSISSSSSLSFPPFFLFLAILLINSLSSSERFSASSKRALSLSLSFSAWFAEHQLINQTIDWSIKISAIYIQIWYFPPLTEKKHFRVIRTHWIRKVLAPDSQKYKKKYFFSKHKSAKLSTVDNINFSEIVFSNPQQI